MRLAKLKKELQTKGTCLFKGFDSSPFYVCDQNFSLIFEVFGLNFGHLPDPYLIVTCTPTERLRTLDFTTLNH